MLLLGLIKQTKMKNLLSSFLFCIMLVAYAIPSNAQPNVPLTYNYQVTQLPATTKYTSISATTYTGAYAATQVEDYLRLYSDSAGIPNEPDTFISVPKTLTLRVGGVNPTFTTVIPTTTVFSVSQFKLDTMYRFTYQGVTDSVIFHSQVRYSILARSVVLNVADAINDQNRIANALTWYAHVFRVPNPPTVPVY